MCDLLHETVPNALLKSRAKTRVRFTSFGRSRSLRVIQGRWFWYQSKARMRLLLSRSLWLCSYLAPFLRYVELLAKNCLFFLHFCYPSLIRRPLSHMFPLEFRGEVKRQETRVMGLSCSEDRMIVAGVVLAWYQRVTDGRLDGWMVRRSDRQSETESIIANTALGIVSYMLTRCKNTITAFSVVRRRSVTYTYRVLDPRSSLQRTERRFKMS